MFPATSYSPRPLDPGGVADRTGLGPRRVGPADPSGAQRRAPDHLASNGPQLHFGSCSLLFCHKEVQEVHHGPRQEVKERRRVLSDGHLTALHGQQESEPETAERAPRARNGLI